MSESDDSLDGAEGRTPSDKILTTSTTLGNLTTMRHKTSSWSSSEGSRSDPKTPSSGSPSGMSEQRDDLDELPYLTPYKLRTTGGVLMHRLCNDMKCGLESIKSEQERANVQTAQLMGEGEVNDKRVKTLEEKVSRLESKLNRSRSFGLAVTLIAVVLFVVQADVTTLTMALMSLCRKLAAALRLLW